MFYTDEVETHALVDIHLQVSKGEYLSIAGPFGLRQVHATLYPGPVGFTNRRETMPSTNAQSSDLSAPERARIRNRQVGFIFQSFNLIGDLAVYENVELPLRYRGMSAADRKKHTQEALEKVGMAHRVKHFPAQLSGGQQQRVAVARALVGDPAILLADEPTGNLDSHNGEAVMELLADLHQGGATICMVTHDDRYASHADRTVHLFDGRVVDESSGNA